MIVLTSVGAHDNEFELSGGRVGGSWADVDLSVRHFRTSGHVWRREQQRRRLTRSKVVGWEKTIVESGREKTGEDEDASGSDSELCLGQTATYCGCNSAGHLYRASPN